MSSMFVDQNGKIRVFNAMFFGLAIFIVIMFIVMALFSLLSVVVLSNVENALDASGNITSYGTRVLNALTVVTSFINPIVMIMVPYLVWTKLLKQPKDKLGIKKIDDKEFTTGGALGALMIVIIFIINYLFNKNGIQEIDFSFTSILMMICSIISIVALQIFYQGYFMGCLRETRNFLMILLIPLFIEAIFSYGGDMRLFVIDVLMCALIMIMYYKTDSLSMSIGFQIVYCLLQALFMINVYDNITILLLGIGLVVYIIFILYHYKDDKFIKNI